MCLPNSPLCPGHIPVEIIFLHDLDTMNSKASISLIADASFNVCFKADLFLIVYAIK